MKIFDWVLEKAVVGIVALLGVMVLICLVLIIGRFLDKISEGNICPEAVRQFMADAKRK